MSMGGGNRLFSSDPSARLSPISKKKTKNLKEASDFII